MSVRVRLTRVGSKKNPVWRVVVADQRSPRDGRVIEMLGHYNPQTEPSTVVIDRERLDHWIELGAQPTNTIRRLMRTENTVAVVPPTAPADTPAETGDQAEPAETAEPSRRLTPRGAGEADAAPPAEAEAAEDEPAPDAEAPEPAADGDAKAD